MGMNDRRCTALRPSPGVPLHFIVSVRYTGIAWWPAARATNQALSLALHGLDRKSVVSGKSVSVRVALGGRRIIIKKTPLNKAPLSLTTSWPSPTTNQQTHFTLPILLNY